MIKESVQKGGYKMQISDFQRSLLCSIDRHPRIGHCSEYTDYEIHQNVHSHLRSQLTSYLVARFSSYRRKQIMKNEYLHALFIILTNLYAHQHEIEVVPFVHKVKCGWDMIVGQRGFRRHLRPHCFMVCSFSVFRAWREIIKSRSVDVSITYYIERIVSLAQLDYH